MTAKSEKDVRTAPTKKAAAAVSSGEARAHVYVLPPTRFEKFKRLILFIIFLGLLALILKSMGWCIGGVCLFGMNELGI